MTNSEHMHGHTTVTVDTEPTLPGIKSFLANNKQMIGVVIVAAGSLLITRGMLRKEIRQINFSAQFYPDDFIDSEYLV